MNYLKQALTEYLSGLTTKKNEKEIWTKDVWGHPMTVESIDDECYIIRAYWENGQLGWESQWKNNQRHGVVKWWYGEDRSHFKELWENGKFIKEIK